MSDDPNNCINDQEARMKMLTDRDKDKSKDNEDINYAQKVLDTDHYGLDKVKERIVEF